MTRQEIARKAVMAVLTSKYISNETKAMIMRAYNGCSLECVGDGIIIHLNSRDEVRLGDEATVLRWDAEVTIMDRPIGEDKLDVVKRLANLYKELGKPKIEGDMQVVLNNSNLPYSVEQYIENSSIEVVSTDFDGGVLYELRAVVALLEDSIYDEYSYALGELLDNTNITHIVL